jgi:hypothetical protein
MASAYQEFYGLQKSWQKAAMTFAVKKIGICLYCALGSSSLFAHKAWRRAQGFESADCSRKSSRIAPICRHIAS